MKYRHKKTGDIAVIKSNNSAFYTYDGMDIHARIIEDSYDWEKIVDDGYPIGTVVKDKLNYEKYFIKRDDGKWIHKASDFDGFVINPSEIGKDKRYQIVTEEKKIPIFTTEDGKELVVGDRYYTVFIPNLVQSYNAKVHKTEDFDNINYKYFSTEKAVNEYIIKHSKILSLKDICKSKGGDIEKSMLYIDLKKLVEERIKNK